MNDITAPRFPITNRTEENTMHNNLMTAAAPTQDMVQTTLQTAPALATQINQTALAALRQKALIDAAPVWKPAENEVLEGEIIDGREVMNPFGQSQPQAVIRRVDGSLTACWLSAWMMNQMRLQQAQIGDLISLTHYGLKQSARGTSYRAYSLTVLKMAS